MRRGFLYLAAIMDWATRKVLAWRLSNTMDAAFCVAALEEALARFGKPEIFNTDQGSQFTWLSPSPAYCATPRSSSAWMVGDGGMDNVFIEQLWRGAPRSRPIGGSGNQIVGGMPPRSDDQNGGMNDNRD